MPLFGRESDEAAASTPQSSPSTPTSAPPKPASPAPRGGQSATHISAGTKVTGEISGKTDVTIDGRVNGKVRPSGNVVIGAKGVVKGNVEAQRVQVGGEIQGNVRGHQTVEILKSGRLLGDVSSPSMVIGEGAFFKGSVEMTGQEPAAEGAASPSAKPGRATG